MTGEADKIVSDVQAKWAAAFSKRDAETLSALYSRHGFLYGSNPNLYRGKDGAKAYFSGLPRWQSQSVKFTEVMTEEVGADVVSMAGTANFMFDEKPLTVKITWVIVREDGGWKILSHHISSKARLL
jgi:ketosteroid isomerase-like protein